ncbi:MAG: hypothetical protein K8T89_23660 [Planctomycetes bacterium]|nr:hypothetical protein [Planctomycetota bacterium]
MAEHDQSSSISSLVVAACREFGWDAFAQELKQLLIARTNKRDQEEISIRDAEWLAAFCCEKSEDPEKLALARELCVLAVGRFCEPRPSSRYSPWDHGEVSTSAKSLSLLLKALLASGLDHELAKVVQFVEESPKEFNLDDCQVPCLNSLIPWSGKQGGKVHSQLLCWLASVRQQLELATAKHPEPPSNWARPAEVACKCRQCAQLNAFLENPVDEVGLIPAREDIRRHLIDAINRHRCDVKHALERKGSPYSLKLTKTNGSFERAVKRYEANQRLLNSLPEVV